LVSQPQIMRRIHPFQPRQLWSSSRTPRETRASSTWRLPAPGPGRT
jgi:hypothetical protein